MASNSNKIAVVKRPVLDVFLGKWICAWMSLAPCPECQQYSGCVRNGGENVFQMHEDDLASITVQFKPERCQQRYPSYSCLYE